MPNGYAGGAAAGSGAAAWWLTEEEEKRRKAKAFVLGCVIVSPEDFPKFAEKNKVVLAAKFKVGIIRRKVCHMYATKYGEFTVLTASVNPLQFPRDIEVIPVEKVELPSEVKTHLELLV